MQPLLTLKPLYHRGQESIGIYFPLHGEITHQVKIIKGARWSRTNACWYLPLTKEHYQALYKSVSHLAAIDSTALRQYLEQRKVLRPSPAANQAIPKITNRTQANRIIHYPLCTPNLQALQSYLEQLQLKAYSPSTICTYRKEFLALLYILKNREAASLTIADLLRYFLYCLEKEKLSEATIHSRINALKFYYEQVLGRERFFFEIPRPKKPLSLPKVLGKVSWAGFSTQFATASIRQYYLPPTVRG